MTDLEQDRVTHDNCAYFPHLLFAFSPGEINGPTPLGLSGILRVNCELDCGASKREAAIGFVNLEG
jgi:hypothetical protein